jgi:nucleotide-binding universal stress UspA family protein
MLTIQKILCPVDFSEPSLIGLDAAVDLAGRFGAEIEVLYVLPILPPQPYDPNYTFQVPEYEGLLHKDAEDRLAAIVKDKIPAGIKATALIGHGSAGKEIVKFAEETKADIIVIASHGHGGWHNLIMGSVAEKVIRHSGCPVFIVREGRR